MIRDLLRDTGGPTTSPSSGNGKVWYSRSTDEGVTWTEPVEMALP